MAEQIITRDYGLPETPMMRKLREEGREEGRKEGREEGREEGHLAVVLRLLTRRCGPLRADVTAQVQQLAPPELLDLAEALLDFSSAEDLTHWLARAT
jgi:predicted transposase YdaD